MSAAQASPADAVAAAGLVPPGRWAVGVSGGADSVALLRLLQPRNDLHLHVVHLDHELRGQESEEDAQFVAALARRLGLSATIGRRSEVESTSNTWPANPSARYRAARLTLFRQVVAAEGLDGLLLAHHADDRAETVLQRLLRGSGVEGLAVLPHRASLGGLVVLRPLRDLRRAALRDYLRQIGQDYREDSSNVSDDYARNRLRKFLAGHEAMVEPLLQLADAAEALRRWTAQHAPPLNPSFPAAQLADLPDLLARHSAGRWLKDAGAPAAKLSGPVLSRLVEMCRDAAKPPRTMFPGQIRVRRRRRVIEFSPPPPKDRPGCQA